MHCGFIQMIYLFKHFNMINLILEFVKQFEKQTLCPVQIGEEQAYLITPFTSTTQINRKAANFFGVNEAFSKAERGNVSESECARKMNKVQTMTFKKVIKFVIFPFFIGIVLLVEAFKAVLKYMEDTDVTTTETKYLKSENYYNEKNDSF